MAHITGTATDRYDLWDKLLDFLQNNADLVAAGQNWSVVWQVPDGTTGDTANDLLLKGPGLAGQDEVFVALRRIDDSPVVGESTIWLRGAMGVDASAADYASHVNSTPYPVGFFLDQGEMPYWIVANGRCFKMVAKLGNTYQALYGGFFLPYASPDVYGMPLFIGGTRPISHNTDDSGHVNSWRDNPNSYYRNFPFGASFWYDTNTYTLSTSKLLGPDSYWYDIRYNNETAPAGCLPGYQGRIGLNAVGGDGTNSTTVDYALGASSVWDRVEEGFGGDWPLMPITLYGVQADETTVFGILDGVYLVPGQGQSAENIATVDGVDHVIFPDVNRQTVSSFWALALD